MEKFETDIIDKFEFVAEDIKNRIRQTSAVCTNLISLIWQRVSTAEVHFQANSIKYIQRTLYSCIKFGTEILILHYDKIHVAR
jgi:hypothetical protein